MEFNLKLMCLIASLVIFFTFIQGGFSIKCFDCRSDIDPKCADPFDNTSIAFTDCQTLKPLDYLPNVSATMCRKIKQKVHGEWRYIRGCAYLGEPGVEGDERLCLSRTETNNIFIEDCTCNNKDGCNTSSNLRMSKILISSSVLGFIIFRILI